jgi:hypothetical protein
VIGVRINTVSVQISLTDVDVLTARRTTGNETTWGNPSEGLSNEGSKRDNSEGIHVGIGCLEGYFRQERSPAFYTGGTPFPPFCQTSKSGSGEGPFSPCLIPS